MAEELKLGASIRSPVGLGMEEQIPELSGTLTLDERWREDREGDRKGSEKRIRIW